MFIQFLFPIFINTYCVLLSFPVCFANAVDLIPLYNPATPPIDAPIITEEPICEKANSKRPLCLDAPSGNMNSGIKIISKKSLKTTVNHIYQVDFVVNI